MYGSNGEICQLQERFDISEYTNAWGVELKRLKQDIANNEIEPAEADEILRPHYEARKELLKKVESFSPAEHYFEPNSLPKDCLWGVRTDALKEFIQREKTNSTNTEKPLRTTERNTYHKIIAGLCDYSDIDIKKRGVAAQIEKMTQENGDTVDEDTIYKVLAKIIDTVGTRKK